MAIYKLLSIDETGKASYGHKSKLFVLSGIVIPEKFKLKLDKAMRKLKKKYFKDPNIVFHMNQVEQMKKALIEKKLGNTANPSVLEVLI